jgi:magnesium-transporting ATPase (P-type)
MTLRWVAIGIAVGITAIAILFGWWGWEASSTPYGRRKGEAIEYIVLLSSMYVALMICAFSALALFVILRRTGFWRRVLGVLEQLAFGGLAVLIAMGVPMLASALGIRYDLHLFYGDAGFAVFAAGFLGAIVGVASTLVLAICFHLEGLRHKKRLPRQSHPVNPR